MLDLKAKSKGFTLIEAIVATALFAVTVSSIMGVYLSTLRLIVELMLFVLLLKMQGILRGS